MNWTRPVWKVLRAPILMASSIVLLASLRATPVLPREPDLFFALVIVIVAAVDGRRAPLLAGLIVAAYKAYAPYLPGVELGQTDGRDLFTLAATAVVASLLVGGLRERADLMTIDLAEEHRRVERTTREKRDFMNAAAHQLRTPLTVVLGYLSMLNDGTFGAPSPRWAAILAAVGAKAQELGRLTDQLLLSARLEMGTAPTAVLVFDLRDAASRAVERLDPRATLLDATVVYQLPSRPALVRADPDQIAIILDNLLNNSLEHSDDKPWIKVTVLDDGDPKILVEDRGRGIPSDMRERIFDRFVRVGDADASSAGTGLGLALSRELAERHGGSVTLLRTEPGKGSVFALRLPASAPDAVGAER
ncbi:MAG: ATP-binding protein [Candidatus Dormibacteraceae bacterium]